MIPLTLTLATFTLTACAPKATDDTASPEDTDTDTDTASQTTAWGSRMVLVPAGTFTMGGGAGDPDDFYEDHQVKLTHDFGRTPDS